jgi:hypothetical protein
MNALWLSSSGAPTVCFAFFLFCFLPNEESIYHGDGIENHQEEASKKAKKQNETAS